MLNFDNMPKASSLREEAKQNNVESVGAFGSEKMLKDANVALLHGEAFGRPLDEFSYRLSFTDFDGEKLHMLAETQEIDETFINTHCEHLIKGLESLI